MVDSSTSPEDSKPKPRDALGCANMLGWDISDLVRQHHAAIYGYAFRLSGSQADAEDLTQQTFLICQQKLHQLREAERIRGWLFSVLRNCFLKSRRKRIPTPASNLELNVDEIPEDPPGEEQIDRQLLQGAINDLPNEFRLVLVMFYYEECSYKDIADKLNLPIGTVMSRLSRAKSRLRQKLMRTEVTARI